jgi:tRNA(fMet)-specific endonuclease VapC
MILLDSSVLIELFRKSIKEKSFFYKLSQTYTEFGISSITYYEVGIGNRKSHFDYWDRLSDQLAIIPFDKACSRFAIDIYLNLRRSNNLIDIADILIGATAKTYGLPHATLNEKHFDRIMDIEIIRI